MSSDVEAGTPGRPPASVRGAALAIAVLTALLLAIGSGVPWAASATAASKPAGSGNGGLTYRDHVFPLAGAHWTRGAIGEFGAPRNGGRAHEGFDIVARCGVPVVAARGGRVRRVGYDPVLYGHYALIHGAGERRSYFYTHLRRPAAVRRGEIVWTGQRIGAVGATGNARSVGCHLHFEIHISGRPIDPEPLLRRWDRR